jgi:multidrug efflux pump subunit AcrA (membrane-fusion protein)
MESQTMVGGTLSDKLGRPLKKIFLGQKAKRNILVTIIFLTAIGYVYYTYFGKTETVTYEYVAVAKKDIKKSVEGSGKVVSLSELSIQQLQNSGKVTAVYVKPGDFVKQGQILATMDNRQAAIQLAQAKASYDKVVNGSTKEEMAITNQSVVNAKQSYEITKQQQDTAVASAKRTLLNTSTARFLCMTVGSKKIRQLFLVHTCVLMRTSIK